MRTKTLVLCEWTHWVMEVYCSVTHSHVAKLVRGNKTLINYGRKCTNDNPSDQRVKELNHMLDWEGINLKDCQHQAIKKHN